MTLTEIHTTQPEADTLPPVGITGTLEAARQVLIRIRQNLVHRHLFAGVRTEADEHAVTIHVGTAYGLAVERVAFLRAAAEVIHAEVKRTKASTVTGRSAHLAIVAGDFAGVPVVVQTYLYETTPAVTR